LRVQYHQQDSCTDNAQLQKYLNLDQRGSVIAEYVWIDANGGTRSKCKVSIPDIFLISSSFHYIYNNVTPIPGCRSGTWLCTRLTLKQA